MFRKYRDFDPGEFIVVAADTSSGMGDYCGAVFLSKDKLDVPLVYHSKSTASEMTPKIHTILNKIHDDTGNNPLIAYERNNGGMFEMDRLAALNRMGKYDIYEMPGYGMLENNPTKKLGWDTNTATRPKMIGDLKEAIDHRLIDVTDEPLIKEMFSFIIVQTTTTYKAMAEQGSHDDLIMALAIAWQLQQEERKMGKVNYNTLPQMRNKNKWKLR